MAERTKKETTKNPGAAALIRAAVILLLGSAALAGAIYGAQSVERTLMRDPRFYLPGPADYGEESPNVTVEGLHYASRVKLLQVFAPDYGRSIYLLPLDVRRASLLRLSWVRDATVRRIWPNRLDIQIAERQPAAFVEVPFGPMSRYALIDSDGVILDPPSKARFNLPVLRGVRPTEALALRGQRVRRMQRMLRDLGHLGDNISEVDVADLDDLKVRLNMKDQAFLLELGDSNFAPRLQNFFNHYSEVHARVPWASSLDLRLEDRITAIGGSPNAQ